MPIQEPLHARFLASSGPCIRFWLFRYSRSKALNSSAAVRRLSIAACLRLKRRNAGLRDRAQLAVDICLLDRQTLEDRRRGWVFRGPVQARPGQQLHVAVVNPECMR